MKPFFATLLAAVLVVGPIASTGVAAQDSRSDQSEARKEMNAGRLVSLRQIEARILPMMRDAEYIGPAFDSTAMAYRLKFIREGRVLYVDVDARTGRILGRSR